MAGTANVVPAEIVVHDAVMAGDLESAHEVCTRIYPLLDTALTTSYVAAVKAALKAVGFSAGRGMKRPRPAQPRSVASADARRTWPEVDAGLARGAVEWALTRTRTALRRHDIAAAFLVDPVNIRYLTGTSLMPVWTLHSIDRYLLVPVEGEPVLWEFASAPAELTSPSGPLETRTAISWSVFGSGEHSADRAALFAAEVAGVLRERGIHDGRIGVDRLDAYGFLALQRRACTWCRRSWPLSRPAR
jgi:hypothetical protein